MDKDVEELETAEGWKMVRLLQKAVWHFLKMLDIELTEEPTTRLLHLYPRKRCVWVGGQGMHSDWGTSLQSGTGSLLQNGSHPDVHPLVNG